ncbi:MAG TPA: cobyric acid synthase [Acidimicrobiia bacterium]|nr:cobyric acid synthase [Acidimicrobiia bacterium]
MVLGCTSAAGKSFLVTALARWFARRGVDVVPFKAQNMSNNARVVEGGEIGVAQWLQARAAGVEPSVDMNPVLLKPEADTRSQVVVSGRVRHDLTDMPWRERGPHLWPPMEASLRRLLDRHQLVLIEGAGSPAEINLPDLVNNRVIESADAAGLLVADIDRGGAFAHVFGTWSLVPETTRSRLAGYVLNRFRGDASLLAPGPEQLTAMTSLPLVGVVPMVDHQLPDEEGGTIRGRGPEDGIQVAVVRFPFGSNVDEFHLLPTAARMSWADSPSDLDGVDLVILPGSKHVAADVRWLRERGLADRIVTMAGAGTRVLGICGGAMMLGVGIDDADGIEGAAPGLGLLPMSTEMVPDKITAPATVEMRGLSGPWSGLNGLVWEGYEIRHGRVSGESCQVGPALWSRDSVLATTVHGLLEDPAAVQALTGRRPEPVLEATFERLADLVDETLDTGYLESLTGI